MTSVAVDLRATMPLELIALDRPQLEEAHQHMIAWARQQIWTVEQSRAEDEQSLAIAKERKWATAPLQKHINIANRRIEFYTKVVEALEAGYVIVPNFQMNIFAIRTTRETPVGAEKESYWESFTQNSQMLASGDGEYKNPQPVVMQQSRDVPDEKGGTKRALFRWPDEFADIAFPAALAKPALMSKTAEAMTRKVFDEIGVAVDRQNANHGDPIILGRIRNPRRGRSDLTFFIGWYLDPSRI